MKSACILIAQCVSVGLCAAIWRDAIIYNATTGTVETLYVSGKHDKFIKPGEAKRIVYPPPSELLLVNIGSQRFSYPATLPPGEFVHIGTFRSTFKIVLGEDRSFYVVPYNTPRTEMLRAAKTQPQPNGWPNKGSPAPHIPSKGKALFKREGSYAGRNLSG
jgi:hypothetical protein